MPVWSKISATDALLQKDDARIVIFNTAEYCQLHLTFTSEGNPSIYRDQAKLRMGCYYLCLCNIGPFLQVSTYNTKFFKTNRPHRVHIRWIPRRMVSKHMSQYRCQRTLLRAQRNRYPQGLYLPPGSVRTQHSSIGQGHQRALPAPRSSFQAHRATSQQQHSQKEICLR